MKPNLFAKEGDSSKESNPNIHNLQLPIQNLM